MTTVSKDQLSSGLVYEPVGIEDKTQMEYSTNRKLGRVVVESDTERTGRPYSVRE